MSSSVYILLLVNMFVFKADNLVLYNQLMCFSLAKTTSPISSLPCMPIAPFEVIEQRPKRAIGDPCNSAHRSLS